VPRDATTQQIKLSYRKLALKHHPDRHTSETDKKKAHENFAAIGHAYEILGDEGRRREHDEGVQRQEQQQQQRQQRQHPRRGQQNYGSGPDIFDDIGGFGEQDPFASMFNDPFFGSPFGGRRSRGNGGGLHSEFHFTDPFELFEQFFAEEMGGMGHPSQRRQQQQSSRSSRRGMEDPFASDPFFSSHGSMFGGGGMSQMMSNHFGMMNSMMSQMHQMHSGSMFGGFGDQQHQQLMGSNGHGGGSSFQFSSSSGSSHRGQGQSVSTSTRTTIVNGVRTTVKERTVVHPDGRLERHTETIEGDGNDSGRLASANRPALGYGGGGRRRHY